MVKRRKKGGLRAEFTVEAAIVFSILLILLAGVLNGTLKLWQKIRREAESLYAAEASRGAGEISPVDLVEIGLFLREWVPETERTGEK